MCPLCKGITEDSYKVEGQVFLRCVSCGLVFSKSDTRQAQSIYGEDYFKNRGHTLDFSFITKAKRLTFRNFLRKLTDKKGRLMEIGCSTGICLKEAKEMGWDIYGIDVSKEAVEIAKNYLGTKNILAGELSSIIFPHDFFSAVVLFDALEHIPDPFAAMHIIYKILQPGGQVLMVTPNIRSISARFLKQRWPHFMAEHLFYFSPQTIRMLLEGNGLRVERIGWCQKFVTPDMLHKHFKCHREIFMTKPLVKILEFIPQALKNLVFPFNIGEMYVLARKKA